MKDFFVKGLVFDWLDDGDVFFYIDGSKLKDWCIFDEYVECDVYFVFNGM